MKHWSSYFGFGLGGFITATAIFFLTGDPSYFLVAVTMSIALVAFDFMNS